MPPDRLAVQMPMALVRSAGSVNMLRISDRVDAATASLRQRLLEPPAEPTRLQLLHGDVRAANLLWSGDRVSTVLDFEEARFDHRVDELAWAAVLLGTRYHDWGPITHQSRHAFLDAYAERSPLTESEQAWLPILLLWCSLASAAPGDPAGWAAAALADPRLASP